MLSWYVFADLPWNFFGNFDGYLMAIGFGHFDTMFLGNLFGHIMANFFGNLETIKIIYQGVLSNDQVGLNSEVMGETFQAAQLTHERFLTIDHSCKIYF